MSDPLKCLEELLTQLKASDQVLRSDRKCVEETVRWLEHPADRDPQEVARRAALRLDERLQDDDYSERPEGYDALLEVSRSLKRVSVELAAAQ